ncbi:hypothetical protein [Vibrio sp. 03_296]|uniref:hypothetical protein n=1 Tax=Vibrio sp. 03_296 TaxID=2024409 RepID=UPI001595C138|nr:hypothetical protein [Vibrio sp. 03_296]
MLKLNAKSTRLCSRDAHSSEMSVVISIGADTAIDWLVNPHPHCYLTELRKMAA